MNLNLRVFIICLLIVSSYANSFKNKKINVCINPYWTPIEFMDKKIPKGISIDILKQISKRIGLKLNFIYTKSWSESQLFLKNGKCDITPTAVKTAKREKYAIFTKPYLSYDLAIITTESKPYVTDISAISDKTITRNQGSGLIFKLKQVYPNLNLKQAKNFKEMFQLVSDNKVYATIATLPVFAYYKKRYNLYNLKIAGFTGWKYDLRIMVNKNKVELRDLLDSQLKLLSPKFTQEIYEKWIVKTKPEFDYREFFIILFSIILIILFFIYWIITLHKKNKELKKLSEVKSQFLANMSHELRTPLNALLGFTQLLKDNQENCKKYIHFIDSSAKIILTEIDNILNLDRLNREIKIEKKVFKSDELTHLILYCEEVAKKRGLEFNLITENLPKLFYGDIEKIRNILIHLIDNAIKFTDDGEIVVTLKYKDKKLFVSVKDTGIGISEKNFKKIFDKFVQLDDAIDKKYKGMGLGLSIVKKLVEGLGGEIKLKSRLKKGSEFFFEIPIEEFFNYKNETFFNDRILIVEDNKANQMFMKVILEKLNLKFDIAENGEIALNMYKNYHYPLILMDINMPIMDGISATKKIREYEIENNLSRSKIIAVTANAIDGDEMKFLRAGMNAYLSKPIDIEQLKELFKAK